MLAEKTSLKRSSGYCRLFYTGENEGGSDRNAFAWRIRTSFAISATLRSSRTVLLCLRKTFRWGEYIIQAGLSGPNGRGQAAHSPECVEKLFGKSGKPPVRSPPSE